jgi:hypothetical protein
MKAPFRRLSMILIAAPLMACGGSPTGSSLVPAAANAPQKCRRYATELSSTFTLGGATVTETQSCVFDKAAHALLCTATGDGFCASRTETKMYPSVADFVEEADAVGRRREAIVESTACGSTRTQTLTYDAQKRLVRWDVNVPQPVSETTYTGWDAQGRPTSGSVVSAGIDQPLTIAYDDAARTMRTEGRGFSWLLGYDGIGDVVNEVWVQGDFSYTTSFTVAATAEVCL